MLFAITGSVSKNEAAAVGEWGIGFLLLSVVLLAVLGITAVIGQLRGVVARDVESKLADDSDKNTPPETWSDGWAVRCSVNRRSFNLASPHFAEPVQARSLRSQQHDRFWFPQQ
jgi:hypothetical protein